MCTNLKSSIYERGKKKTAKNGFSQFFFFVVVLLGDSQHVQSAYGFLNRCEEKGRKGDVQEKKKKSWR